MKNLIAPLIFYFLLPTISCKNSPEVAENKNDLENTAWYGVANIPTAENVTFKFTDNEFKVYVKDKVVEEMKYKVNNDSLIITKIIGGSPCPVNSKGIYQYSIENQKLSLKFISEECDSRQYNLNISNFVEVK
ncbi:hypothetical protein Q73A0000_15660 [Kaistella flava (ex Peng et al. 2021)]|uniref:Lipoprotein n=1 Tax=Kaistella flava (ex Peng et al. 2021) TaxID=2038776 RepID=A0A7M2YE67_9FLAO|nr:hypothetical protein [Kaistella flava (ex Peng et al. 2021)]QOW11693.1 hypothetical protein Q73A0000_15660 [Kaistella flava (ex Peng et al. 2021)]